MTKSGKTGWDDGNHRYLIACLDLLRLRIESAIATRRGEARSCADQENLQEERSEVLLREMSSPPSISMLSRTFGLSPFERDILLFCAAVELDSRFVELVQQLHPESSRSAPTFSLAMSILADAHWSALLPSRPLRYWHLVELGSSSTVTMSPLRIDERVLHYLAGVQYLDERLMGVMDRVERRGDLVPSQKTLVDRITHAWSRVSRRVPVIQLCGDDAVAKLDIAAAACERLGMILHHVPLHMLPTGANAELDLVIRLIEREVILGGGVVLLDLDTHDGSDTTNFNVLRWIIDHSRTAMMVLARERITSLMAPVLVLEIRRPGVREQRAVWEKELPIHGLSGNGTIDRLTAQFDMTPPRIRDACFLASTSGEMEAESHSSHTNSTDILWDACRMQTRHRLDQLAQRIEPSAGWGDLVLPSAQTQVLRNVIIHCRQRSTVYETWGFAAKSRRSLGISALFSGPSGTGKTMAAEVLAKELRLDLYRIDLSQVMSKYIGETEKNLRRVFDAAEEGGVILLFDEADALFGKRSEVKDSHDRYANIEISYLLQRMEAYRGLAILTTNMRESLDQAFLRRIRFIVQFPFPDAALRAEIWRRTFPEGTPTDGLDIAKLSRLNVAGGNIRNIALHAAFLAADAGEPVKMKHVLQAAKNEYAKTDRALAEAETGSW